MGEGIAPIAYGQDWQTRRPVPRCTSSTLHTKKGHAPIRPLLLRSTCAKNLNWANSAGKENEKSPPLPGARGKPGPKKERVTEILMRMILHTCRDDTRKGELMVQRQVVEKLELAKRARDRPREAALGEQELRNGEQGAKLRGQRAYERPDAKIEEWQSGHVRARAVCKTIHAEPRNGARVAPSDPVGESAGVQWVPGEGRARYRRKSAAGEGRRRRRQMSSIAREHAEPRTRSSRARPSRPGRARWSPPLLLEDAIGAIAPRAAVEGPGGHRGRNQG